MEVQELLKLYAAHPQVTALDTLLKNDTSRNIFLKGLNGSGPAMTIASLFTKGRGSYVCVLNDQEEAGYFYHDLMQLTASNEVYFFPSAYRRAIKYGHVDPANEILRTEVLSRLQDPDASFVIVTYPDALAERVVAREVLKENTLKISVGEKLDNMFVSDVLDEYGFEQVDYVYEPGQYALRGSILDVFSFSNEFPYRIDFFGDEVESIRRFDIASQLSTEKLEQVEIVPDMKGSVSAGHSVSLPEFAGEAVWWADDLSHTLRRVDDIRKKMLAEADAPERVDARVTSARQLSSALEDRTLLLRGDGPKELSASRTVVFDTLPQPAFNKRYELLAKDIHDRSEAGYKVCILSDNKAQIERLGNIFASEGFPKVKFAALPVTLHEGFVDNGLRLCLYTDHQLFERYQRYSLRGEIDRSQALTVAELNELKPGDYVVHIDHGVGRFGGLVRTVENGKVHEAVKLEYRDGDVLLVNVHALHRISRYKDKDSDTPPRVYKLGSGAWQRMKNATKSAVKDIARELIKLYAERAKVKGYAFPPDGDWQSDFEARFEYDETDDQLNATSEIKKDMERSYPMDRLLCGDVGYGKTEVAIRAAFKAVQDSKQVAYLAPTTILAQQIYDTFSQRMKDFPVNVDLMCRFRSAAEQKKTIEKLKKGEVDIIIGTHRILSKDVQFKDLGLLVIDEEQRFGVTHKEKIKQMKVNVDVLTLTATPIPRTLHMSLIGIRDMSVLEEPPMDRVPIQTYVMEYNDELVREAINRELARNGQVYYVYNKVRDIADITAKLQELVPDVTVAFAHGQMKETELERIMYRFINGEIDVLVSTTIIETGLDISNVNTMIIHDADNMGLSQLYQLRGRVGRSNRTAYAFLMYRRNKMLKEVAEKRLAAIKEYSDLGSGFKIAMRDLEIRGAGNLLGAEQSGHMEAVGYDLYCKMLSEAVKEAKGIEDISDKFDTTVDIVTDAYIPAGYIANEFQKLDIYKRIAGIETEEEKDEMLEELIDRFGEPPKSVLSLLRVARLKALAHAVYITEIKQTGSLIKLTMFERAKINAEKIPELITQYKSSLKFNMAENPYFTFDLKNGSVAKKRDVLDVVEELVSQMRKELITAE